MKITNYKHIIEINQVFFFHKVLVSSIAVIRWQLYLCISHIVDPNSNHISLTSIFLFLSEI